MENVYDDILSKRPIEGVWDKEYSMVPIGALDGRKDGDDIKEAAILIKAKGACRAG